MSLPLVSSVGRRTGVLEPADQVHEKGSAVRASKVAAVVRPKDKVEDLVPRVVVNCSLGVVAAIGASEELARKGAVGVLGEGAGSDCD